MLRKFLGMVAWFESEREITVLEVDGEPLMGMAMMQGHRLTIDVRPGGTVILERPDGDGKPL